MKESTDIPMRKVPPAHAFLDLSDYARRPAEALVRLLLPTPISPIHITLFFTALGLIAAFLIASQGSLVASGLLLLVKNVLDAADGALARARRRPSRVGRFLDSNCDFLITLAVFLAIVCRERFWEGHEGLLALSLGAVLSSLLQGTIFNYYSIRYREQTQGDSTSHILEEEAGGYPYDNPQAFRILFRFYQIIYGWQDRLMIRLDRRLGFGESPLAPSFLTAASLLGLGIQILLVSVSLFIGRPLWSLWIVVTVFNVYAVFLLFFRRQINRKKN